MTNLAGNLQNGIRINGKHSYRDFGLFVSKKVIEMPSVKRIRETVPYMNGSHDFSKLNGELAYEDRIISYTFDITGNDAEEMNKKKHDVSAWLCTVHEEDIQDDDYPHLHFVGSYHESDWEEDDGQGELTIKFICHPYMYANTETVIELAAGMNVSLTVKNDSDHRVIPTVEANGALTIQVGGKKYVISGSGKHQLFTLEKGNNQVTYTLTGNGKIRFYKEVF